MCTTPPPPSLRLVYTATFPRLTSRTHLPRLWADAAQVNDIKDYLTQAGLEAAVFELQAKGRPQKKGERLRDKGERQAEGQQGGSSAFGGEWGRGRRAVACCGAHPRHLQPRRRHVLTYCYRHGAALG